MSDPASGIQAPHGMSSGPHATRQDGQHLDADVASASSSKSPRGNLSDAQEKSGDDATSVKSKTAHHTLSDTENQKAGPIVDDSGQEENLHRSLSDSQITMIAIGGSIGTGLIIASGQALAQGGPAGLLIGYLIMGFCCWIVLTALGEITAYLPLTSFTRLGGRYVDEAFGCALSYCYLAKYLIISPSQVNASALLISYWRPDLSGAIFISVFIPVIVASNFCGVRFFGRLEYGMSFAKILVLCAVLLGGFIISLGGNPRHDRIGFRYWKNGGAFVEYKEPGALGRFLGVWSTLTLALYAYIGSELVGVCAGETSNPRRAIPKAVRMVAFRILFFYIGGVIIIGMLVPSNDRRLVQSGKAKNTASASPFVIAIQNVGIDALPSVLNAALLLFTLSAANSDLYVATRTLYGLARDRQVPFHRHIIRTNRMGVPYVALTIASLFLALAYLNVSAGGSTTFGYLTSTVTIFGGIAWLGILITHIRFMAGCKAQGLDRKDLPYRSPLQPFASYFTTFIVTLVLVFKGFNVFWPKFDYKSFITNYIGIPVVLFVYFTYKIMFKTKLISASEMDIHSGARRYDVLDDANLRKGEANNSKTLMESWQAEPKWYRKPLVIWNLSI